jgi:hypothetical protein
VEASAAVEGSSVRVLPRFFLSRRSRGLKIGGLFWRFFGGLKIDGFFWRFFGGLKIGGFFGGIRIENSSQPSDLKVSSELKPKIDAVLGGMFRF